MARRSRRSYDVRTMAAMAVYVVVFLAVWPLARSAVDPVPKIALTLTPVLPLLYVIWLMAERIRSSDELEQRTHLIGLGVASVVVAIVSIVAGFLAAASVLTLEHTAVVLVWTFPLQMIAYGIARSRAARRYGVSAACDDEERMPAYQRFLWAAAINTGVALYGYWRWGADTVVFVIAALAFVLGAIALLFVVRRRRRGAVQAE